MVTFDYFRLSLGAWRRMTRTTWATLASPGASTEDCSQEGDEQEARPKEKIIASIGIAKETLDRSGKLC